MKNERIMALDFGESRIGLALSDPSQTLASPLTTLDHNKKAVKAVFRLLEEHQVKILLIGYPITLKGENGLSAEKVDKFIEPFLNAGVKIIKWDERFSSHSAMTLLLEAGKHPFKDKGLIDRSAAAIMLQEYLDSTKNYTVS